MKKSRVEFFEVISSFSEDEYYDSKLTYIISPLLMKIKPSMTVSVDPSQTKSLKSWIKRLDDFNIEKIILKKEDDKHIIFLYNRLLLEKYLFIEENSNILEKLGYIKERSLEWKLEKLKLKFSVEDFPHELGIFLGIPARDVLGFMNGEKSLYTGYWKVYEDEKSSRKLFQLYDMSKDLVAENILNGRQITDSNLSIYRQEICI